MSILIWNYNTKWSVKITILISIRYFIKLHTKAKNSHIRRICYTTSIVHNKYLYIGL